MLIIGLTGSIGMGKSTIAKRFVELAACRSSMLIRSCTIFTAARQSHQSRRLFPGGTINGAIDRARLSAHSHGGSQAGSRNSSRSCIRSSTRHSAAMMRRHPRAGCQMAVLENPLLFEMGGDARVDYTVVVSAGSRGAARAGAGARGHDGREIRGHPCSPTCPTRKSGGGPISLSIRGFRSRRVTPRSMPLLRVCGCVKARLSAALAS